MSQELGPEIVEMDLLLRRASRNFQFPTTPHLAAGVLERLQQPTVMEAFRAAMRAWWRRPAPRAAVLIAAALVVALAGALVVPQSRDAVAHFFGLGHVRVHQEPLPIELPPVLQPQDYAEPISLKEAQQLANGLRLPAYPEGIAGPDAIYLQRIGGDLIFILVYQQEGFDLHQSRLKGTWDKTVPYEYEETQVDGLFASWLRPGGHVTEYRDENDKSLEAGRRTVEHGTLLWERDGFTYRLETSLSKEEAVRVAESLR